MSVPKNLFQWQPQPEAAKVVWRLLDEFCQHSEEAKDLGARMLCETGTRLFDWVDHFVVEPTEAIVEELRESGFEATREEARDEENRGEVGRSEGERGNVWEHPGARLPRIVTREDANRRLVVLVESVKIFLEAHSLPRRLREGAAWGAVQMAQIASPPWELWLVERHGDRGLEVSLPISEGTARAIRSHRERFLSRKRDFSFDAEGFRYTIELLEAAKKDLGTDRACDLFFETERAYWMGRNRAGQIQKTRQDLLGLGWANQDHHTYRSSREHFASLVRALELLGFTCRERFYAGAEAGWGAQVLEQRACGLTVFADVDLLAEEVAGDFAHEGLEPLDALGTIGLWCRLHGEAILQAGLHHLESQFDFDAAREQLAVVGIKTMAPFTHFPHLKQAFTEGPLWKVAPERLALALEEKVISKSEASQFAERGALGSHLEILERNEGYNGFNQSGVSQIISKTDPRGG